MWLCISPFESVHQRAQPIQVLTVVSCELCPRPPWPSMGHGPSHGARRHAVMHAVRSEFAPESRTGESRSLLDRTLHFRQLPSRPPKAKGRRNRTARQARATLPGLLCQPCGGHPLSVRKSSVSYPSVCCVSARYGVRNVSHRAGFGTPNSRGVTPLPGSCTSSFTCATNQSP